MGDSVGILDNVISELEEQMEEIKSFSQVLKKIENVSDNIQHIGEKVNKDAQSHLDVTTTMNQSAILIKSKLDELKIMIDENLQALYKDNKNYQRDMDDSIRIRIEKFKLEIENKIDGVAKKSRDMDKNILDMNKKLTSVLEAYEKDKNRGFFARLFNK